MHESEWCNLLYHVEFAINSTVAESIRRSPFELVYGKQVRLPVDIIVGNQSRMPDAAYFAQHIQKLVQDAKNHLKRDRATRSATLTNMIGYRSIW